MKFVGRTRELDILNQRFKNGKKEFGIIYGSEGIGKSSLLREFLKDKPHIFFQAKKTSAFGQLRALTDEARKNIPLPDDYNYSNWQTALENIIKYMGGKGLVIAIDEYTNISNQDSNFCSMLANVIKNATSEIYFLLTSSDIPQVRNALSSEAPLFELVSFNIELKKLDFRDAIQLIDEISNDEKVRYLTLTATYPYYLKAIDSSKSFEENVKNLFYNEYSPFFNLGEHLLSSITSTQDVYHAILYAIANFKKSNKAIADYINEDDPKVSKYIVTLLNYGVVEKREPFMGNKKSTFYRIVDPMVKFWYKFIYNNQEAIKLDSETLFNDELENINNYVNNSFDFVARLYLEDLNINGELTEYFPELQLYRPEGAAHNNLIKIDGVAEKNGVLLIMDAKPTNQKFDLTMLKDVIKRAQVFNQEFKRKYYIFSKQGFIGMIKELESEDLHFITPNELFIK